MKKIILLLFVAIMAQKSNATIWLVDNNSMSPLILPSIQAALDSANAHDTIMITGSQSIYFSANFIIDKPLRIIGEGYNNSSGKNVVIDDRITITSDSVEISGLYVDEPNTAIWIESPGGVLLSNVLIERCHIKGGIELRNGFTGYRNIVFRNNIFRRSIGFGGFEAINTVIDTLVFENNIIDELSISFPNSSGTNTVYLRNNIYINGTPFPFNCSANIYNNIIYGTIPQGCTNCIFNNNITWASTTNDTLPGGNITNLIDSPLFVEYPGTWGNSFSDAHDFHLSNGSPAIGTGTDSLDMGIFGGYFPFIVNEGPRVPIVEFINISHNPSVPNSPFFLQFDARIRTNVFYNGSLITSNDSVLLTQAEYWIDSIPVPGSGNLIPISIPMDTINFYDSIQNLQLDTGTHVVSIRVKDNEGNWSFTKTDSVRSEYYDVDFTVVSPPIIRAGQKTKFKLRISNNSSVDLVEKYIVMQSFRNFNAEVETVGDSINGTALNNVSKTIFVNDEVPHYDMPLWVGKLQKHQSISYNIYVTFPSLIGHENLKFNYQLLGSEKSEIQEYFEVYGADSSALNSLYIKSLLNTVDILKDTLGLGTLTYNILKDSLRSWLIINSNLFNNLLPINYILKTFLNQKFNFLLNDSIADKINLLSYNVFKFSSYNMEESDTGHYISLNNKLLSSGCTCPFPNPVSISLVVPPLQPTNLFYTTSGCKQRCFCQCNGSHWDTLSDSHTAIDLRIRPNADILDRIAFDLCQTPVIAMVDGVARVNDRQDEGGCGYFVQILGTDNNNTPFTIHYCHLCEIGRPPDLSVIHAGDVIGYVGSTGFSTGTHLHVDIDVMGQAIPPSCLYDFNSNYPPLYLESLSDEPCLPPVDNECGFDIPDKCDNPDSLIFAEHGRCPSKWVQKQNCGSGGAIIPNDPNDKVGNIGYAFQRYIKPTDELEYGVLFENLDSATASAKIVTITDTLDLSKVDKSTFYFESFIAGEMLVVLPDSIKLQNLDTIYIEEPVNDDYVQIQASFDSLTGVINCMFTSLNTNLTLDTSLFGGFLPPDTTNFDGNGLVSYKVMPLSTIPDDTVIYNKAHIKFDFNPSIATGTWFNTIDRVEPLSSVSSLPTTTYDTSFTVHWTGTDDGAGIIAYDIYAKLNSDTAFTKWLSYTYLDSATYTGAWNDTLQFYSIAYDSVGNVENKLALIEASTILQNPVGINYIYNSSGLKIYPNPTSGKLIIETELERNGKLNVEIYNLLNQKLLSFDGDDSSNKYFKKEIDVSSQAYGIYFIHLKVGGQNITKKFILKKN